MKQPKKLKLSYKKLLKNKGMDPKDYMLVREDKNHIVVIHKSSREVKPIELQEKIKWRKFQRKQ